MFRFLLFAIGRYAGFFSHLACFLAGVSLIISFWWGVVLLSVSLLLGSLSAFLSRRSSPPASSPAPSPDASILFSNILSQLNKDAQ